MPRDIAAKTQPTAPVTRSIKYSLATFDLNMAISWKMTRRQWCAWVFIHHLRRNIARLIFDANFCVIPSKTKGLDRYLYLMSYQCQSGNCK